MFTSYVGVLLFFYVNYFILIPKLYFKKKILLFIVSILAFFLMVHNVPTMVFGRHKGGPEHNQARMQPPRSNDHGPFEPGNRKPPVLPENIYFQFFFITFLSIIIRVNLRLKEAENEKLKSELAYLRGQINPHFLFNTLNSIYALTLEKSDEAPNAVVKVSHLMRFVISESSKEFVLLKKELEYLENFVGLQKLRLTDKTKLEFKIIDQSVDQLKISPLLLISFVENAFKYGVNPEVESFIKILILAEKNILTMTAENTIVANVDGLEKTCIGIQNTRKRLEMVYPKMHKLDISEDNDIYSVNLTIQLND